MDYGSGGAAAFVSIFLIAYFIFIGLILLLSLAVYVLDGFAFMKLFRKVGIEPWAAWVPIFNRWRLLELGGQPGWISVLSVVSAASIVAAVFEAMGAYRIGLAFRKPGSWVVLFIFLPFVWAWLLAADNEPYDLNLAAQRGYGPPLVGYGSVRGPYVPRPPYPSPPAA
jgi:hypothetical protein